MKEYKIVPGPKGFNVNSGHEQEAFKQFEDLINVQISEGWQYHSMETITITSSGCIGSSTANYFMLIFERDK